MPNSAKVVVQIDKWDVLLKRADGCPETVAKGIAETMRGMVPVLTGALRSSVSVVARSQSEADVVDGVPYGLLRNEVNYKHPETRKFVERATAVQLGRDVEDFL